MSDRPYTLTLLMALALSTACVPSPKYEVGECAGDADVDDTTLIVTEFKDSVHEMVTCGNLTFQLIGALLESANSFMTDPDTLPSAFTYDAGLYVASGTGVEMDLSLLYGDTSPVGTPGALVEYDLFDPDTFFVDLAGTDNGDGTVTLTFTSPGPLAAMLGLGDAPESPLIVTDTDAAVLAANLGALELTGAIYVDDVRTASTVTYELNNPAEVVTDVLAALRLDMEMISATATREDLGQSLAPTVWNVEYGQALGTLVGQIEADVTGGPFDFHLLLDYAGSSSEPAVTVTCL